MANHQIGFLVRMKATFLSFNLIAIIVLSSFSSLSYGQANAEVSGSSVSVVGISNTATDVAQNTSETKAENLKESVQKGAFFNRPLVDGKIGVSLFSEDTYEGRTSNNPINSYMLGYVMANLYFSEDLYLSGNFRFSGSPGDKTTGNYFFDEGFGSIGELTLRYDADKWSAYVGRTRINYSLARDYAAGLWGGSFARREVGIDGMMAIGGSYSINAGKLGNHALSASVFMTDTTILADSFGIAKDPTPLSAGGPANTGKFNNVAFAVDGLKIDYLPRFRYQIGTVQMQTSSLQYQTSSTTVGQVDSKYLSNEQRYVAAGLWDKIPLFSKVVLTPLIEYDRINNSGGISGYNKNYYIGSLLFGYKQWNFGISAGVWDANWQNLSSTVRQFLPSSSITNDRYNQMNIALGYSFQNGIKAAIGYRKENRMMNMNTQTIGINLKYDLPFAF